VTGFLFSFVSKGFAPVSHPSKTPLRTIDSPHLPGYDKGIDVRKISDTMITDAIRRADNV